MTPEKKQEERKDIVSRINEALGQRIETNLYQWEPPSPHLNRISNIKNPYASPKKTKKNSPSTIVNASDGTNSKDKQIFGSAFIASNSNSSSKKHFSGAFVRTSLLDDLTKEDHNEIQEQMELEQRERQELRAMASKEQDSQKSLRLVVPTRKQISPKVAGDFHSRRNKATIFTSEDDDKKTREIDEWLKHKKDVEDDHIQTAEFAMNQGPFIDENNTKPSALDKNEARSFQVTVVPLSDSPLSPMLPRTVECMNVNIVPTCCHKGSFQLTIGSEHQSASIAVTPMTLGVNFITGMTEFHGSSKWSFTHSEINDQTDMLIQNPDLFWKNNNEKPKRKITFGLPHYIHDSKGGFYINITNGDENAEIMIQPLENNCVKLSVKTEYQNENNWHFTYRKYNSEDEDAEEEARIESAKKKFHIDIDND